MRARALASLLIAALTGLAALAILLAPANTPERDVAAMLLVLVLPGASLSRVLSWPEAHRHGGPLLLIPALSLAVTILDSAFLYVVGVRLDLHAWTISLGAVSLVGCAAGLLTATPLSPPHLTRPRLRSSGLLAVGVIGTALLVTATVLVTVRGVRAQNRGDHFTALWALPQTGPGPAAQIGVLNHEGARRSYIVSIYIDGRLDTTQTLSLGSGQGWTGSESFIQTPATEKVRVTLSLANDPASVYRSVDLRLPPAPISSSSPS